MQLRCKTLHPGPRSSNSHRASTTRRSAQPHIVPTAHPAGVGRPDILSPCHLADRAAAPRRCSRTHATGPMRTAPWNARARAKEVGRGMCIYVRVGGCVSPVCVRVFDVQHLPACQFLICALLGRHSASYPSTDCAFCSRLCIQTKRKIPVWWIRPSTPTDRYEHNTALPSTTVHVTARAHTAAHARHGTELI